MDPGPRSLAANTEPRRGADAQDGPRLVRQRVALRRLDATPAGSDPGEQMLQALDLGGERPPQRSALQAFALGRADISSYHRATFSRAAGRSIRASFMKATATKAVMSAMLKLSPAI